MKIRRRTLAKIGLFLLAGAVVNVGVAWGAILLERTREIRPARSTLDSRSLAWPFAVPPEWPAPTHAFVDWSLARTFLQIDTLGVSHYPPYDDIVEMPEMQVVVRRERAGLPFRALERRIWWDTSTEVIDEIGGWVVSGKRTTASITLPLIPTPIGFVANTTLYAALVSAPFGLLAHRHSRRLARGLCPRCKYDIRGLDACPECGVAIRRKAH